MDCATGNAQRLFHERIFAIRHDHSYIDHADAQKMHSVDEEGYEMREFAWVANKQML